ncbi:MAG: ABC transporter ATP-binding protein [Cellulosilyticum sp.]|nr:ABC transporter ATP-binding protein [Cellulosilyticum sp.]
MSKKEETKKPLSHLLEYCKGYLPFLIIAAICAIGGTILTILGPDKLSEMTNVITDGIMTGIDMDAISKIAWTLVGFYALSLTLSVTQGQITARVTQRISQKLRGDLSQKINKLPMWYYNQTTTGDVLSRVTNDVDAISQALNQSVGNLVTSTCLFFGSFIMMLKTNVILTVTAVGATFIGFVVMGLVMKKSQGYFIKQQEYLGKINGHIEEVFSGHTIVRAYNAEAKMSDTFHGMNNELKTSAFKAQFLSGLMMPVMIFIGNLGYVAVCIVGAMLALNGHISFGVIVAFIMYIRYFTQPLGQIAQAVQSLQPAAAASKRVFEFLYAEEMEDESHKKVQLEDVKGEVEFKKVHFGYEGTQRTIINNFSAHVKPGQKIAIVGPTGAGKTTLINLLMRYNEINSGEILIDGTSIHDISKAALRDQFCMVLQDTWLFEGSIKENLVYNNDNISDEAIERACKAVGMDHFIKSLPEGYNTILNDKLSLSAGQKQQLTIARAMIKDAPMLILDEATSSVDTRTELVIQKAMDQLMEGRTSFVIAHRLSTIKNADVILVLKDGDILESGNHEALMEKGGFYADLYNSQFEKTA